VTRPGRPLRILHGLTNVVGIGGHLAKWQRANGHQSHFVVYRANAIFPNHDERVFPEPEGSKLHSAWLCFRTMLRHMRRHDVYHFYASRSFIPGCLDLPLLRLFGKKIVMTYCGSEVRLAAIEARRNPFWDEIEPVFAGTVNDRSHDWRKRIALRWQGLWCHRVLAPRDMYAPAASVIPARKIVEDIWIHNLSATELDGPVTPLVVNPERLKIIHAPSNPVIKGTRYIREAIETLRAEGLVFDYVELQNMPHPEAIAHIATADIVADELLIGSFGSLAVEAMTFGRPIISFAIDEIREKHFPDSPTVNATIHNVTDVLRDLVKDGERRVRLGAEGQAFVARHMDYETINKRMINLYRTL